MSVFRNKKEYFKFIVASMLFIKSKLIFHVGSSCSILCIATGLSEQE